MTKDSTERKPWTKLEWGVFIAAAVLVLFYFLGWRLIGLSDILRFARRLAEDSIHTVARMLRHLGSFLRDLI